MNRHVISYVAALSVMFTVCSGAAGNPDPGRDPAYPSGFEPGTRVVLLADTPVVGEALSAGMAGTVICCDAEDCSGALLVSWDLWTGGKDEESRCVTSPVGPYPAGSATWVDPREVLLGRPVDIDGILREDHEGCLYLESEDGEFFYLMIGPEFTTQWSVILPGSRVRVRGLLNTSGSAVERICPQRDGDIYHPIIAASDWIGESCCDPFVCGFTYGDRVVLIGEDDPNGAVDLSRGASGTIICCNSDSENSVLVSWDLWTNGGADDAYLACNERITGLFPARSTWWVPAADLARCFRTECGALQNILICSGGQCEDVAGVGLSASNRNWYYLPDLATINPLPCGQFLASGLYAPYATLPTGLVIPTTGVQKADGKVILHSVLLPCPEPSCCEPAYVPGDRVVLLADEPGGAEGLLAEATGSVICCNANDPNTPVLVSWDFWTGGHDETEKCTCCLRSSWFPETSGWWMACSEIEPIVRADLYDLGEDFRGFSPASLVAGQPDQELAISGVIANRGGAKSDAFFIEIYASADTEITSDDYFIGLVAMDIDDGGVSDLSWIGEFPTDIPAGVYHIGWLIDPDEFVEEAKETNNMVVVGAGVLTVTDP